MKKFVLVPVVLFSVVSLIGLASAQSLKQKDMIASDLPRVAELATKTNQACGTKISFKLDYSTYADVLNDVNNQSPWAYLANATDALQKICTTAAGKQAVQAKIKSVIVSHASKEFETLTGTVFRYGVPYSGHSPATVVDWLQNHL
ncbi:hypothetical protein GCM10022631_13710 [Deinococcus rubellus]|uniref:hypothetical protein n=1 Tax=Deinococcus rubellus TaxID=1889240 RepID=UPI0031E596F5